jgi:hypothetical protein
MGRNYHSRLAVWTLAALTVFAIAGAPSAFADGNKPHVSGGGQFFVDDPNHPGGDKVNIGIDGKFDKSGMPQGHLEYHNEFTGLHAHGKLTSLTFEIMPSVSDATSATGQCANPLNNDVCSCVAIASFQSVDLSGQPAASVSGTCDGNDNCSFSLTVVDNDPADGGPGGKPKNPDFVCNVKVTGQATKKNLPPTYATYTGDSDPGKPLNHGHIEIKGVQ